eukprot:CAMPEP_0117042084 /NCGR_PEP_ID=MMETSP0472-20121206/29337_1 /TAXON_ID=693140 ORGANISM="Tiarina fusus, Strain LIS" /NCGR_SAMPLE_ID=MMETSP0472 /ASSEMBLY_ACC=CAM_ASM_000603 /LENGTH=95 /DNA_ID=CAMNT_0004753245 /DNA_START=86 /DNA_END=370 /DNA_ORIENTATION=+
MSGAAHAHEIAKVFDAKGDLTLEQYKIEHAESIKDPSKFWAAKAREHLDWFHPFDPSKVLEGSFEHGDVRWFAGGQLNLSYNALDRHVSRHGDAL